MVSIDLSPDQKRSVEQALQVGIVAALEELVRQQPYMAGVLSRAVLEYAFKNAVLYDRKNETLRVDKSVIDKL